MNKYSTYDSLSTLGKIDEPIVLNQETVRDALIELQKGNRKSINPNYIKK
jgi:hypothetical protein